jgi:hypothetical protein
MKNIRTWLTLGALVAAAAAGCSVSVVDGDGGAGASGGSGGTGGTGGSTGGAAGTTGGTAGSAAGTAGSSGAAGAGDDAGGVQCTSNPNTDSTCTKCGFNQCQLEHCACNAVSTCRTPMAAFYTCAAMPNAMIDACAVTFATNANVDGSGGLLASDLAECIIDKCENTCQGRDASNANSRELIRSFRARMGHADQK